MTKYSDEFKLMVVRDYPNSPLGFKLLVRKYEMKSYSQLRNGVNIYKKHGAIGLFKKEKQ
ncbi:transposase [Sporosarcina sp. FSL K6-5500]|uniref:transposase n=1 Tax=Sporosarcina sp. FSL K6-5500 TaxID=2921558 RepID=UPI0030FA3EFA